jgi:hypothetical protein
MVGIGISANEKHHMHWYTVGMDGLYWNLERHNMIVDLLDNCERMTRIQRWMVITGVDFEFSGHDVVIARGFAD